MDKHSYYMTIAMAVRKNANCLGRKVGAVIVRDDRIVSTGYNGTPEGIKNCCDGGCVRCKDRETYQASIGYDVCICVHAEQNAIVSAARFGNGVEGATVYSTLRPCFDCTKAMVQAKIKAIYYLHDWQHPIAALREQHNLLQSKGFDNRVHQLKMADPEADWANNKPPAPQVAAAKLPAKPPARKTAPRTRGASKKAVRRRASKAVV
ncbi:dCMP deaminase family protein [Xanthomonas translucens]|uniref:deoxycytidylate deaminase n=1 Tax=Xanthomonas campestris pv. translucens TaxID=343 RepID=UPI00272CFDF2|nr:dCMP deaminase family protein [Xanthomonas translucens]WLA13398.1 dCMP deaminase family protein [Xanthomonas translucens]